MKIVFFVAEEAGKAVTTLEQTQLSVVLLSPGRSPGDAAEFAEKPFHPLARGVRVDRGGPAGLRVTGSVQLEIDEQLQVLARQQSPRVAAMEKMP